MCFAKYRNEKIVRFVRLLLYTFSVNTQAKLRIGRKRGKIRSYVGYVGFAGYVGFIGYVTGFKFFLGNLFGNFFLSISRSSIRTSRLRSTRPSQRRLTEFFRRCHLRSIRSQMLSVKVDRNPILSIRDSVNRGPMVFRSKTKWTICKDNLTFC